MPEIGTIVKPQDTTWLLKKGYAPSIDFPTASALAVDGVIPSGTIFPKNDATARGITVNDQKLGKPGALLIKGVVAANLLTEFPSADALEALRFIVFLDGTEVM